MVDDPFGDIVCRRSTEVEVGEKDWNRDEEEKEK